MAERGPVVISLPGDVAVADAPSVSLRVPLPATTIGAASAADLAAMADLINQAQTVAIFGGDGCEQAQDEVRELAARLKAPVGYSFKGKPWLEHDNPNAVGMTGLLGYGGCHAAINHADVLLMLGTDFPFTDFLPHKKVKTIQVDRDPGKIGRRVPLELGVVGDVAATLRAVAPMIADKHGDRFLREHVAQTEHARRRLGHYVTRGPGLQPIRPEYVAAVLSELADDDAVFTKLHVGAQMHGVVALKQGVEKLVKPNRVTALHAAPVVVPRQELLHRERGREFQDLGHGEPREPVTVRNHLRPRGIEDREGLLGVASRRRGYLVIRCARTPRRPVTRVADHRGHRAHNDDHVMAEPLEPFHRPQRDRVTQVQVRSGRVVPGVDAQRAALVGGYRQTGPQPVPHGSLELRVSELAAFHQHPGLLVEGRGIAHRPHLTACRV